MLVNFKYINKYIYVYIRVILCTGTDTKQIARSRIDLICKKCESASDKLHADLYNVTVTCSSQMNIKLYLFMHTVYNQISYFNHENVYRKCCKSVQKHISHAQYSYSETGTCDAMICYCCSVRQVGEYIM
jgi:hypothetical protein